MLGEMALLFGSPDISERIEEEPSVARARSLARRVKGFDDETWEQHRYHIVEEGTYHKFAHSLVKNRDLKAELLATGDEELVLASPLDGIWGIGYEAADAVGQRQHWGENLLGKALMTVRAWIRKEEGGIAPWASGAAMGVDMGTRVGELPQEVQGYESSKGYISPNEHKYWETDRSHGLAAEYYDKSKEFGPTETYDHQTVEGQGPSRGTTDMQVYAPDAPSSGNALAVMGAVGAGALALRETGSDDDVADSELEDNSDDELRREVIHSLYQHESDTGELVLVSESEPEEVQLESESESEPEEEESESEEEEPESEEDSESEESESEEEPEPEDESESEEVSFSFDEDDEDED